MKEFGNGKVVPIRGIKRDAAGALVPLWPGCRIGSYRVDDIVDRTPVAIIYHGRDQLLGRPVLIKECAPSGLVQRAPDGSVQRLPRADARVHREILREFALRARTLAKTEHPGLARVHGLHTHRDGAYLIMHSRPGLHLGRRVRSLGPLSPVAIRKLVDSLTSALAYLHARDLVHRGVRPSHVHLGEDGSAMLLDFGLALDGIGAAACNDLTRYSAPEAFAGQPNSVGPASDIYSLAATLYFAISGLQPPSPRQRVARIHATGIDPMPMLLRGIAKRCPPGLAPALARALSIAPSERPASIAEWLQLSERRRPPTTPPTTAPPVAAPDAAASGRQRRSGLRRIALGGVVASSLAAAFWWGGIPTSPDVPPASPEASPTSPGGEAADVARETTGGSTIQAVRERLIERLMQAAERDIAEQRLTRPPGDNAHEKLRRVLELAPAHELAQRRLDGIVARYLELAQAARERGDLDVADDLLDRAEQIAPQGADVTAERRSLTDAQRSRAQAAAQVIERPSATATTARRTVPVPQPKPAAPAVADQGEMLRFASASFMMGSKPEERERGTDERLHLVSLQPYAIGRHEVTVAEFGRFVEDTGYVTDAERDAGGWPGCLVLSGGAQWEFKADTNWRQPGFPQRPDHPVVCVSLADASAYAHWRGEQTGLPYRLPTEAEWEHAARNDAAPSRTRENASVSGICRFANAADRSMERALNKSSGSAQTCDDGSPYTAAVGSLDRGARGLSDMLGNVWEWTCSDYSGDYGGAERRCADPFSESQKVVRGGGWNDPPAQVRVANRGRLPGDYRYANLGFRIALGVE